MFTRWTRTLLLTLLLAGFGQVASAQTEESRYYAIPAGPLSSAINQFMLSSGISISMDANRIRTLVSPGLQGNYGLTEGLQKLLENTGYQATPHQGGYLLVEQQPTLPATSLMLPALEIQGRQDSIYDQSSSVSRISREDMDRTGPRHASEILQATPGVFTVTNEQNPSVSVNIRGLKDFGRINMNIDGMRQNYQRSGHGQRNGEMFFDTEFLSGVEITKGAHAGAGGAGASGGVATFQTLETADLLQNHEDRFGGRLRLSHGVPEWENGQKLSGSLALAGRPTENTDVLVAYSWKNTAEYQPGKNGNAVYWGQTALEAPINVVNSTGQDMQSWLAKARWMPTDHLELKLTALTSNMTYGESQSINTEHLSRQYQKELYCNPPNSLVLNDPQAWEYYCEFEYDPANVHPISNTNKTASQSYALDAHYAPGNDWIDLRAKLYTVTTRNTSTTSANTYTLHTQTETLGLLLDNTSQGFAGNHTFTLNYGLEWFRDENKPEADSQTITGEQLELLTGATPYGKRAILGTWLRTDWNYKALTISPALRWEHYSLQGTTGFKDTYNGNTLWQFAEVHVDHAASKLLPSLGVALDAIQTPQQHLQLFANASLGWRPPAITETLTASAIPFHNPPITTYPNWLLQPEETQSAEIGFNWRLGSGNSRLNIKLTQFYNRTENYILYATGARKPSRPGASLVIEPFYVNTLNDLIFEGQELQLDFVYQSLYGSLGLTRTERRTDDVFYYDGKPTPYLYYHPWAVGGPNGESPADYCPDPYYQYPGGCHAFTTLYDPQVPEWMGKLTLGKRWLQDRLDTGATLTCASQTGDSYFTELVDHTGAKQGLRGFCVTDLYASYQWLEPSIRLGMNLKNLTDREYIQAMGDDLVKSYAPGRTLTAYMQWDF